MSILAIILALVLDRLFPALRAYRSTYSLSSLWFLIERQRLLRDLPRRLIPCVLLFPILLVVWLLYQVFTASVLVFSMDLLLAFYCFRPSVLNEDVDGWLNDLEAGKVQSSENTQRLFGLANRNLYTLIFWFALLGPLAVVTYRLLDILQSETRLTSHQHWVVGVNKILGWLEWLPAILSSFLFMVAGNFEAGLRIAQSIAYVSADIQKLNEDRLRQVGVATIAGSDECLSDIEFMRRSRGLLLRTLVLWLVCASLFDFWW